MSRPTPTLTQVVKALREEADAADAGFVSRHAPDVARVKRNAADRIERAMGVEPGKGTCLECRGEGEVWGNGGKWPCPECRRT